MIYVVTETILSVFIYCVCDCRRFTLCVAAAAFSFFCETIITQYTPVHRKYPNAWKQVSRAPLNRKSITIHSHLQWRGAMRSEKENENSVSYEIYALERQPQ